MHDHFFVQTYLWDVSYQAPAPTSSRVAFNTGTNINLTNNITFPCGSATVSVAISTFALCFTYLCLNSIYWSGVNFTLSI